ncbi:hypothetical protein C1645_816366 [Glomus cerebriforme]|uniref:Uncharacterized protein n=1 Tax=Glomus cerebriforme TaxID=658196 RepID=A0A397TGY8_9GLOM|nr:hypothetical protein C1645_816366 [Glomus cerebriforme]
MLAIIIPNYFLFMIYDYEFQQQTSPDFEIHVEERDINYNNLEIIINTNNNPNPNPDFQINQKYCGNSQCKFLFVYSNSGPETKTNVHFINTFAYLANQLNRTLVLTNVGRSKIDSCKKFPFEFYYNIEYLKENFPDLSFISQENFQFWTKERIEKPDFHYLHLSSSSSSPNDGDIDDIEHQPIIEDINQNIRLVEDDNNCLKNFEMKFDDDDNNNNNNNNFTSYQKILFKSKSFLNSKYRKNISKFLISNLKDFNSEILLIKNDINKEIFPRKISSSFNISSSLTNLYSKQINQESWKINLVLEPFIAVYWSMIDIKDSTILSNCAEKLINTLTNLKENFNLYNIYLATDYPISSSTSSLFNRQSRYYRRVIHLLNSTMTINTWYSLNAFSKISQKEDYLEEFKGKGIANILDKLVCINSDYFITAPSECFSKSSNNFIKDIINTREKLYYDYDNQKIQNIISKW